jgi:hypothetical protein
MSELYGGVKELCGEMKEKAKYWMGERRLANEELIRADKLLTDGEEEMAAAMVKIADGKALAGKGIDRLNVCDDNIFSNMIGERNGLLTIKDVGLFKMAQKTGKATAVLKSGKAAAEAAKAEADDQIEMLKKENAALQAKLKKKEETITFQSRRIADSLA